MKLTIAMPADRQWWGNPLPNGSHTGIVGDLQYNRADISWGNLFIIPSRDPYMDFTNWYAIDEACIMVPKPLPYANILATVRPFSTWTWVAFLLTLIIVTIFYSFVSVIQFQKHDSLAIKMENIPLFVLAITLMQNSQDVHKISGTSIRLATILFLLTLMVVSHGYQKSLMSMFTVHVNPDPIDDFETFNEILKAEEWTVTTCCR